MCCGCNSKELSRAQALSLLEQEGRHKPISVSLAVDDGARLYKCGFQSNLWANEQGFYDKLPQEVASSYYEKYFRTQGIDGAINFHTTMYWRDYLLPDGIASFDGVQFWKNGWPDERVPLLTYRDGKHYITNIAFKGPFVFEVTGITQGDKPTSRKVEYSWKIDWNRRRPGLKLCCSDIGSGKGIAAFELYDDGWRLVSQE